jgi:hypothetical protein
MKLKVVFLAVVLVVTLAQFVPVEGHEEAVAPPNGATLEATESLNIRASPCTDGRLITTIGAGVRVTYTNKAHTGCGYTWWSVKGSFGEGWAASNWLRVVQGNGNLVYGTIAGLHANLINKLADLARLAGSRVRVHSGCRPGGGWHTACKAADFHVDGQTDLNVYRKALANRRQFDRYQFIYHVPGRRACSTGEHLHLSVPDNYPINSFCHEFTCNWAKECSNIRIGKSGDSEEQITFDQLDSSCNATRVAQPECWKSKN